jgi:hypothetical protein
LFRDKETLQMAKLPTSEYPDELRTDHTVVGTAIQRGILLLADRDMVIDNAWFRGTWAGTSALNFRLAKVANGVANLATNTLLSANRLLSTSTDTQLFVNMTEGIAVRAGDVLIYEFDNAPGGAVTNLVVGIRLRTKRS